MKFLIILLLLLPINIKAYQTSATSSILMNMDNHQIIYGHNIDLKRPIASISKIMTAILAVESEVLNNTVKVGDEINDAYGSSIYIKVDEELTIRDLVYGLMLRSGNDAALVIAKNVSGSVENFIDLMNQKSKEIGMKNTIFGNPHGLDYNGGNISTAYDMAILTSYAMENEIYREIVKTEEYKISTNFSSYLWENKHRLLGQKDYITGGKTGYTDLAKRTLVTTASSDNINLVAVTLNDGNDFNDHISLFEEAYNTLYNKRLLTKGNIIIEGENYYNQDFYIKNDYNHVFSKQQNEVIFEFKILKKEDYNDGDCVGYVNIKVNGTVVKTEDIYIKKSSKNIFDIIKDWFT